MAAYIQKSVPQLTKSSLAIEEMRSWAEELAHMFNRNADMQERTQVFSCYERGLEKTIKRDFESRGKDIAKLRDFKYPGSTEAARRKFVTGTSAAEIQARHAFHIQWLRDFADACGSTTQTVVLETIARVGREIKWDPAVNFDGNEIRRLAGLLDTALISFEGASDGSNPIINKKLATEAVVKILPERVRFSVRQRSKEGETIDDLLRRMTQDMSEGEVHRDFLKAAEAQPRKRPNEAAEERQPSGWWKAKKNKNRQNQSQWQSNQWYNQGYQGYWKKPEPEPAQSQALVVAQPQADGQRPDGQQDANHGPDTRVCFKCKQPGHIKPDCPLWNAKGGWGDDKGKGKGKGGGYSGKNGGKGDGKSKGKGKGKGKKGKC